MTSRRSIHAIETQLFQAEVIEDKQAAEDRKMGSELLDEAATEPTLDRYLDRSPKLDNPVDYPSLVANLQWKRKTYITAEQKKKEPKSDE